MKKYRASFYYKPKIKVIEIEKESEKCVWINSARRLKEADAEAYLNTIDEARGWLKDKILREITEKENRVKVIQERIHNLGQKLPKVEQMEAE